MRLQEELDKKFIFRSIELAEKSIDSGDNPFGCLIVKKNKIIAESTNKVITNKDLSMHAELLVMKKAQKVYKTSDFSDCSCYSNCEPCVMCSFLIRELKFRRVVFSLLSPYMGGFSKWNILGDGELEIFKPNFAKPPEIVYGILRSRAIKTFKRVKWGGFLKKY